MLVSVPALVSTPALVIVAVSAVIVAVSAMVMAKTGFHARTVTTNDQRGTVAPATSSHRPPCRVLTTLLSEALRAIQGLALGKVECQPLARRVPGPGRGPSFSLLGPAGGRHSSPQA